MVRISPENKKIITVVAMVLLAVYSITSPLDLKGMLPAFISNPLIGNFSPINIAAYAVLLGAWWVATKQTN